MQIHTYRDDEQGAARGYERRTSVSIRLTPGEAENLRSALKDFLAKEGEWDDGWHVHTPAWDNSCEIVLVPDREGTATAANA
jgi:hypothetical protein